MIKHSIPKKLIYSGFQSSCNAKTKNKHVDNCNIACVIVFLITRALQTVITVQYCRCFSVNSYHVQTSSLRPIFGTLLFGKNLHKATLLQKVNFDSCGNQELPKMGVILKSERGESLHQKLH